MSNEEVIKILEQLKYPFPSYPKDAEVNEALDLAIESLIELDKHENCILTMFGDCSYKETGCSDCKIIEKIGEALKNDCYKEGYSQGYIDGSTGADWRGE